MNEIYSLTKIKSKIFITKLKTETIKKSLKNSSMHIGRRNQTDDHRGYKKIDFDINQRERKRDR